MRPLFSRIILRDLTIPIRQRHHKQVGPYYLEFAKIAEWDKGNPKKQHLFYYASSESGEMDSRDSLAASLRVRLAGDRNGIEGYFTDDFQDQTLTPVIASLPRQRGWLPGYTMGKGMASVLDYSTTYADPEKASRAAHDFAERAAEDERDYQREEDARLQQEEADALHEELLSNN